MTRHRDGGEAQNEELQEQRRERKKFREVQEQTDWSVVLRSPHGRRVLSQILRESGFDLDAVKITIHGDQYLSKFQEGRESVARSIVRLARLYDIQAYRAMEDEARGVTREEKREEEAENVES